ncbi:hypothetical protein L218DRAFT_949008 [Marasmius fiardii PR-910]|nr:hypothetical protein L218DRAFT_949008 [Marasmius fiardii PR-910]
MPNKSATVIQLGEILLVNVEGSESLDWGRPIEMRSGSGSVHKMGSSLERAPSILPYELNCVKERCVHVNAYSVAVQLHRTIFESLLIVMLKNLKGQAGDMLAHLHETSTKQLSDKARDHVNKVQDYKINSAVYSTDNEEAVRTINPKGNGEPIRGLAMKGKEDIAHLLTYAYETADTLGGNVTTLTGKGKVIEELAINNATDAGLLVSETAVEVTGKPLTGNLGLSKISSGGELITEKLRATGETVLVAMPSTVLNSSTARFRSQLIPVQLGIWVLSHPFAMIRGILSGLQVIAEFLSDLEGLPSQWEVAEVMLKGNDTWIKCRKLRTEKLDWSDKLKMFSKEIRLLNWKRLL